MFSEMISNEDSSPELGIDTIQKMEESLFLIPLKIFQEMIGSKFIER